MEKCSVRNCPAKASLITVGEFPYHYCEYHWKYREHLFHLADGTISDPEMDKMDKHLTREGDEKKI